MRRVLRTLAKANVLFWFLNAVASLFYLFCIFTPASMLGLSPLVCMLISAAIYFLDKSAPTIAAIAHFALWCFSIKPAMQCAGRAFTFYLVFAGVYLIFEVLANIIILIFSSQRNYK